MFGWLPSFSLRAARSGLLVVAAVFLALLVAFPAAAQDERIELGGKVRIGDEIVVPSDEVVEDDLYVFGGSIQVDGTVRGDLVAFGGQIDVSGTVEGDVLAAGGQVDISGEVAGDVRASGGQVSFGGATGEDILAAGGRVTLRSRASAGQDLIFGAGMMSLAGDVAGSVLGAAGRYNNTGSVGGDETVREGRRETEEPTTGERAADFGRDYLALLVIGSLVILLLRRPLRGAMEALNRRIGWSALAGVLFVVGLIIGLVVLYIVGGLLALGLALAGFDSVLAAVIMIALGATLLAFILLFLLVAWVTPTVVAVWLGTLLLRSWADRGWVPFAALAIGALVIQLLYLVPILGALVGLAVFLLGTGSLVLHWWRWPRRTEPVPAGEPDGGPLPA
jgi:hypothetical protein